MLVLVISLICNGLASAVKNGMCSLSPLRNQSICIFVNKGYSAVEMVSQLNVD